ncbi:RES family NAD+ phosphorylase [Levilactobacillus tujiorum]|uniref:DUF1682 domain-containing protein n=1 Tax=Levilactobacillus tujiorum TaxID=2912243 RepID=A0ABX1L6H6_9LACO|nr:RES family NAD+ phosphorylase [Levilactobacillus tujiorum]MCH5463713.1 RES family NAD+ phosphorylase [Levilactobacillus tujiorum]NLR10920.1 DUF1682 domain-containing protein [Lactobacillus sp. HBUAS51387]NLR28700.1 DUF1682 domain-containing protein [Levilactobacillus tujiorum]
MKNEKQKSMFELTSKLQKTLLNLPSNAASYEVREARQKQKEKFSKISEAERISLGLSEDAKPYEVREARQKQKEKFSKISEAERISLGLSEDTKPYEVREAKRKQKERFAHLAEVSKLSLGLSSNATQREMLQALQRSVPMASIARRMQKTTLGLPESASETDVRWALERQQKFLYKNNNIVGALDNSSIINLAKKGIPNGIEQNFGLKIELDQRLYTEDVSKNWKNSSAVVTSRDLFKLNDSMRLFESRSIRSSYVHSMNLTENPTVKSKALKAWISDTNTSNSKFIQSVQTAVKGRQSEDYEESKESISTKVEVAATQTLIQDIPDSGDKLEVTSEELYELQDLLAKNAIWKACHLPVAERMHEYFSNFKVKRQKISTPLYHGRLRKAETTPYVENELNVPAPYGMPSHGRFNGENQNLYYTSDNVEALKSELKLKKDEVYDAIEFEPDHEFGVVDLTLESEVLMSFCLQRVATSNLNTPVEYFIPTYIMQCLRDNRDVDVVKVRSAVAPGTINYIFLDISLRRDTNVNHVKIYRFLGKSSEESK